MEKEKQVDYKEFARQMRKNCIKDLNGNIICSAELWEQIAGIIETARDVVVPKREDELPPELPSEVKNKLREKARDAEQKLYEKALKDAQEHPENYNDIFEKYENNLPIALALIEWQKMDIERLTINMNAFALAAKRLKEEKDALAKEIFELINCAFSPVLVYNGYTIKEYLAELKKKYAEGNEQ